MPASLSTSANAPKVKHSAESVLFAVDFTKLLIAGETLTGTPTVTLTSYASPPGSTPVTTGNTSPALTIGSPTVNVAPFFNDASVQVAIGAGVLIRISVGLSPTDYVLTVTCATTAGNTRTIVCLLQSRDK